MRTRTQIKQEQILTAMVLNGGNIQLACKNSKAGRTQFYDWIKKYPDFRQRLENIYVTNESKAVWSLIAKAEQGKPRALESLARLNGKKYFKLNEDLLKGY